jgi:hypothetical protein
VFFSNNLAGRSREAAIGGGEAGSTPLCILMSDRRTGAQCVQNPLVVQTYCMGCQYYCQRGEGVTVSGRVIQYFYCSGSSWAGGVWGGGGAGHETA